MVRPHTYHDCTYTPHYITESTYYDAKLPLWQSGAIPGQPFVARMHETYPTETLRYRPGFWQEAKWAWIQYLSALLPLATLLLWFANAVFANRVGSSSMM